MNHSLQERFHFAGRHSSPIDGRVQHVNDAGFHENFPQAIDYSETLPRRAVVRVKRRHTFPIEKEQHFFQSSTHSEEIRNGEAKIRDNEEKVYNYSI